MSLCLTLHDQESIQIGPDITIRVEHRSGKQVRLAIDAPFDLKIDRLRRDDNGVLVKVQRPGNPPESDPL